MNGGGQPAGEEEDEDEDDLDDEAFADWNLRK